MLKRDTSTLMVLVIVLLLGGLFLYIGIGTARTNQSGEDRNADVESDICSQLDFATQCTTNPNSTTSVLCTVSQVQLYCCSVTQRMAFSVETQTFFCSGLPDCEAELNCSSTPKNGTDKQCLGFGTRELSYCCPPGQIIDGDNCVEPQTPSPTPTPTPTSVCNAGEYFGCGSCTLTPVTYTDPNLGPGREGECVARCNGAGDGYEYLWDPTDCGSPSPSPTPNPNPTPTPTPTAVGQFSITPFCSSAGQSVARVAWTPGSDQGVGDTVIRVDTDNNFGSGDGFWQRTISVGAATGTTVRIPVGFSPTNTSLSDLIINPRQTYFVRVLDVISSTFYEDVSGNTRVPFTAADCALSSSSALPDTGIGSTQLINVVGGLTLIIIGSIVVIYNRKYIEVLQSH